MITELVYNRSSPTPTLTCTSTGGMVDLVTWRKDGVEVGSDFSQRQTITNCQPLISTPSPVKTSPTLLGILHVK